MSTFGTSKLPLRSSVQQKSRIYFLPSANHRGYLRLLFPLLFLGSLHLLLFSLLHLLLHLLHDSLTPINETPSLHPLVDVIVHLAKLLLLLRLALNSRLLLLAVSLGVRDLLVRRRAYGNPFLLLLFLLLLAIALLVVEKTALHITTHHHSPQT